MVSVEKHSFTLKQNPLAFLHIVNGDFNCPINICFFSNTSWFPALTAALQLRFLWQLCLICLLNVFKGLVPCLPLSIYSHQQKSGCKALPQQTDNILHTHYPDVYHCKAAENKDFMLWNNIGRFWANCYRKLLEGAHKQLTMGHSCFCWFSRRQQFAGNSLLVS